MASLKDTLAPVLTELLDSDTKVSFEVKPMAVYRQLIVEYETETGKTSPLDPNVTDDQAAANKEVQERVAVAAKHLEGMARKVLNRVFEQVEQVPYGIRWVCKQLQTIATDEFASSTGGGTTAQQIHSLVGGFVFLRYINPAIVTPDGNGLVTKKPSPLQRRNLILVAKVCGKVNTNQVVCA